MHIEAASDEPHARAIRVQATHRRDRIVCEFRGSALYSAMIGAAPFLAHIGHVVELSAKKEM